MCVCGCVCVCVWVGVWVGVDDLEKVWKYHNHLYQIDPNICPILMGVTRSQGSRSKFTD